MFVAAWTARDRYDPERGSLAGWLIGVARHKVTDALRAQQRVAARAEPPDGEPTHSGRSVLRGVLS